MRSPTYVVPHVVDFDPQLREAFLTVEAHLSNVADQASTGGGIFWWDGTGDPGSVTISGARAGDFYIDRVTGDVYRLVEDPYTRGLTGAENESRVYTSGSMWWDGAADPTITALPYRVQDYWLNTATCDIWALR